MISYQVHICMISNAPLRCGAGWCNRAADSGADVRSVVVGRWWVGGGLAESGRVDRVLVDRARAGGRGGSLSRGDGCPYQCIGVWMILSK